MSAPTLTNSHARTNAAPKTKKTRNVKNKPLKRKAFKNSDDSDDEWVPEVKRKSARQSKRNASVANQKKGPERRKHANTRSSVKNEKAATTLSLRGDERVVVRTERGSGEQWRKGVGEQCLPESGALSGAQDTVLDQWLFAAVLCPVKVENRVKPKVCRVRVSV